MKRRTWILIIVIAAIAAAVYFLFIRKYTYVVEEPAGDFGIPMTRTVTTTYFKHLSGR